jgi:transcriptional regulator with XRE-family HTH domain
MKALKGLGKSIRLARVSLGITQIELAEKLNLSTREIIKIELSEIVNPGIFTVKKITDSLGITLNDLFKKPRAGKY